VDLPGFDVLAAQADTSLDLLALALAAAFHPVDAAAALAELDRLGGDLAPVADGSPDDEAAGCGAVLGGRHGFTGNRAEYDHPDNSMLDIVLERRLGLPITLAVVYVEAARRAGIPLAGVGLPGHFVVGHFGGDAPILIDPFSGGRIVTAEVRSVEVRRWRVHEIALRMLNNLVAAYAVRGDVANAIRAAELRLALPVKGDARGALEAQLRGLQAQLN